MFDGLIDGYLADVIAETAAVEKITELRLRKGRPLVIMTVDGRLTAKGALGAPYRVTFSDIDRILQIASNFSVYSINDELIKGYIPRGGVRIGIAGEGVTEDGKLLTVKNISYLAVRIPHQIYGAADKVKSKILEGEVKNTLIVSPPGAGKTTMLRELARLSSLKNNTLIIDERMEIAFSENGIPRLDVGDCDVVSGVGKSVAYENCIRAMNPEVIVTDEIFKRAEVEAVLDIARSGVKIFATLHGDNMDNIKNSLIFSPLLDVFKTVIVLSKLPRVGEIKEIIEL